MQYVLPVYSWHHCTYKSTSSDAEPVTCLTDGITVPTPVLALMKYRLHALKLLSVYQQEN